MIRRLVKRNSWTIQNVPFEICPSWKMSNTMTLPRVRSAAKNGSKSIFFNKISRQKHSLGYSAPHRCLCVHPPVSIWNSVCSVTHMQHSYDFLTSHCLTAETQMARASHAWRRWIRRGRTHLKILSGACSPVTRSYPFSKLAYGQGLDGTQTRRDTMTEWDKH